MKIYLVLIDNGGAHETDNIISVWDSLELAKKEAHEISKEVNNHNNEYTKGISWPIYRAGVKEIELNKSYEQAHDLTDKEKCFDDSYEGC